MTSRWFLSLTVRHATAMGRHVQKLLNHQRDILSPQAIEALQSALGELRQALAAGADKEALQKQMESLEKTANKWLKPYPHPAWRENVEVLLVALAIAMGIRTFFLQPFKIPTGSMQPTLYGVTSVPDLGRRPPGEAGNAEPFVIPTGLERIREWFAGVSYVVVRAKTDGELLAVNPPFKILIFNIYQTLNIGGRTHWIFFPPDYGSLTLAQRAGLQPRKFYRKGEEVVRLKVVAGDHLFVDRLTYNFRPPRRGEIIVFETKGIPEVYRETDRWSIPADQFYIKRLVGLGGERIQIGADRHLIVNGERLTASVPHFENVYSFDTNQAPRDSQYSGHIAGFGLAPFFEGKPDGVLIPKDHYLVMGDNTVNSLDSRAWGYFPAKYVIGKSFFVYWPITKRFGVGYHR
ncbi:MAG TPA: signal peptidase I [Candidatus Paceibacterota bacterium]|nr:signal peptidase I [Candidatus Paceibacterota bacterium]